MKEEVEEEIEKMKDEDFFQEDEDVLLEEPPAKDIISKI